MLIEIIPVIPRAEVAETEETVDIRSVSEMSPARDTEGQVTYSELVTGVPVSIQRYLART